MGKQIKEIYRKAESSFNDPANKKKWQGGVGLIVMVLFVLSSVVFNNTVQALNQVAGSYGYYGGSYGYNTSTTSSDDLPSAPTAAQLSARGTTSVTVGWTAPTTTASGTAIASSTGGADAGSVASYYVHYSTSALSACSGGSSTTSTSASAAITGLSANTAYNFAVCAVDDNGNAGSPLTFQVSTAATTDSATSGGSSGGSSGSAPAVASVTGTSGAGSLASVTGTSGAGSLGVVAAVTGNLGGTATAALAAVGVTGDAAVRASTVASNAAAIALVGADATAAKTLTNALAVAASQNSEISNASGSESAATRLSNFLSAVVPANVLATAKTNPAVATAIAEGLIVPASTGTMPSNLRSALVARMTALGVSASTAQTVNVNLENREKEFVGMYLAFYGTGPSTSAHWTSYLNAAHGARVIDRDLSDGGTEMQAVAQYKAVPAFQRAPFGPLASLVRGSKHYAMAYNLIQNAGDAAKSGVRALPTR